MTPTESRLMQRALCSMLMTENGTEKLDNELTTTLFENITTLAQLHQFKRAEENKKILIASSCNNNDWVSVTRLPITRPEETSHNSIGHGTQVSTRIRTHITFQTCPTIVEICCRRVERSLMLRITILGRLYQIPDNFKSDVSITLSIH